MASTITVTIKYSDNSRSLTESFPSPDTHPGADVIKACEVVMLGWWKEMGHSTRDLQITTKIR